MRRRQLWVLPLLAILSIPPTLWEEIRLASLESRPVWRPVKNAQGTCPGGWSWEVSTGHLNHNDEQFLGIKRHGRLVLSWNSESDEFFRRLWIAQDTQSATPRFLCYQSLTTSSFLPFIKRKVRRGIWLLEGDRCRPVVTNRLSLVLRDPSSVFGWGAAEVVSVEEGQQPILVQPESCADEAGLLDK